MSKINKPRLGRGLSSLISVDIPDEREVSGSVALPGTPISPIDSTILPQQVTELPITERVISIDVAAIGVNPHQPRREFNEAALQELATSLRINGLIQPIVVRQVATGFELIAGERRLRAAKLAGLRAIPGIVKEVDGLTQAQFALVENIQREDLNPVDRAHAYKTLVDELGLSHAELATRLGEDRSSVSNHLRLLDLAVPVRDLLRRGELSFGHAKVLAGVVDVLEQERLAKLVVQHGLSVRNLENSLKSGRTSTKTSEPAVSPHIKGIERAISRQLGMKVAVRSRVKGRGRLVINYSTLNQFDELMTKLGVKLSDDD